MPTSGEKSRFKTDYLNVPEGSGDMSNRPPSPGTARLTSAWKLRWKIGEETYIMPAEERVVIGRAMEGDTGIGFDLTPFGAYHFGVSRMHAVLTLHDGFLYLEDLNSTNGTRINGFQVTPKQRYRLRDGDEIEFGRLRTTLRFETPGSK
ncbi:MAG: FHA domain-containing protein [Anaerolineae bacterium]